MREEAANVQRKTSRKPEALSLNNTSKNYKKVWLLRSQRGDSKLLHSIVHADE